MIDMDQLELRFDDDGERRDQAPEPEPRPSLLDPEETRRVIEDAVERAEDLLDDDQKMELLEAIRQAAASNQILTSDQVWDCLEQIEDDEHNEHDYRSALGPRMREAADIGWIINTGDYRPSQRPSTHGRPLRVWKSLIYETPRYRPGAAWDSLREMESRGA